MFRGNTPLNVLIKRSIFRGILSPKCTKSIFSPKYIKIAQNLGENKIGERFTLTKNDDKNQV